MSLALPNFSDLAPMTSDVRLLGAAEVIEKH
jgi:hypothetical protein